eukprot:3416938-Amphidinium_carterae.2
MGRFSAACRDVLKPIRSTSWTSAERVPCRATASPQSETKRATDCAIAWFCVITAYAWHKVPRLKARHTIAIPVWIYVVAFHARPIEGCVAAELPCLAASSKVVL